MDSERTVSICIPARNAESFIAYTLNNLMLNQYDSDKFEVIICNHGSSDNTKNIILEYQKKYGNIKMFDIPFEGPNRPRARNMLIENATGELLIFIDQDILTSRDFITSHVEAHKKFGPSLVAGYTYGKCTLNDERHFGNITPNMLNLNNITESYQLLKNNKCFVDGRESLGYISCNENPFMDLTDTEAPFKTFWLCNFSVEKSQLERIGGFDEYYREWGLDDDDTAYSLELNGLRMIFSNKSWSYHMYHPVIVQNNAASWRKNCSYFFSKFNTRELELYKVYQGRIDSGLNEIAIDMNLMPSENDYVLLINKIANIIKPISGNRLGVFINNENNAKNLMLAECFNPYLPINTLSYKKDNCRFWSILGLYSSFKNKEIDETIIIVDLLMFLNDFLLKLLMLEMARISKKITFYLGKHTKIESNRIMFENFMSISQLINFEQVEYIEI